MIYEPPSRYPREWRIWCRFIRRLQFGKDKYIKYKCFKMLAIKLFSWFCKGQMYSSRSTTFLTKYNIRSNINICVELSFIFTSWIYISNIYELFIGILKCVFVAFVNVEYVLLNNNYRTSRLSFSNLSPSFNKR